MTALHFLTLENQLLPGLPLFRTLLLLFAYVMRSFFFFFFSLPFFFFLTPHFYNNRKLERSSNCSKNILASFSLEKAIFCIRLLSLEEGNLSLSSFFPSLFCLSPPFFSWKKKKTHNPNQTTRDVTMAVIASDLPCSGLWLSMANAAGETPLGVACSKVFLLLFIFGSHY